MTPPVHLLSVATAVPPYRLGQEDVQKRARTLFERRGYNIDRLIPAYANAGNLVNALSASHLLGVNQTFTISVKTPAGATLNIERTIPANIDNVMNLH